MKKIIAFSILLPLFTNGQNTFKAIIKSEDTRQAIPGATVQIKNLKLIAIANDTGVVIIKNIPDGKQAVEISNIGYKEVEKSFLFPLQNADTIEIFIAVGASELDEVTVTSTRAGRSINNTPTRVEVIAADEIHEEATMRPGDIRMLLSESTIFKNK